MFVFIEFDRGCFRYGGHCEPSQFVLTELHTNTPLFSFRSKRENPAFLS